FPTLPGVADREVGGVEPGQVDAVGHDADPVPLDAVELLDVEGRGAGRADDAGRLGSGDVGTALVEGPGPAGVAVGEAARGQGVAADPGGDPLEGRFGVDPDPQRHPPAPAAAGSEAPGGRPRTPGAAASFSASASRQGRSGAIPAAAQAAPDSTLLAGRG